MTVDAWLEAVLADSERRQLPDLRPLLEALAQATRSLRAAAFICDPSGLVVTAPQSSAQQDLQMIKPPNDQVPG